jgi:hypothetical protein
MTHARQEVQGSLPEITTWADSSSTLVPWFNNTFISQEEFNKKVPESSEIRDSERERAVPEVSFTEWFLNPPTKNDLDSWGPYWEVQQRLFEGTLDHPLRGDHDLSSRGGGSEHGKNAPTQSAGRIQAERYWDYGGDRNGEGAPYERSADSNHSGSPTGEAGRSGEGPQGNPGEAGHRDRHRT